MTVGVTLAALTFLTHERSRRRFLADQGAELGAIADLRVGQIVRWRAERLADGKLVATDPLFLAAVRDWWAATRNEEPSHRPPSHAGAARLAEFLGVLREVQGYERISLLDDRGGLRLRQPAGGAGPSEAVHLMRDALRVTTVSFVDLHAVGLATHMAVIAPLRLGGDASARPDATVIFEVGPERFLYPLLQSWPTPSPSGETLLVRREGDDVVFLNELRHRSGTALKLRFPVTHPGLPAAIAALGREGVFEGQDYRGVRVLAVTRRVPDSPWFLVSKIDREEVTAPLAREAWLSGLLTLAILALAAIVAHGARRRERRANASALGASEARNARLVTAITQAPISVMITNAQGAIEYVNPAFERLTGYSEREALGQNPRILRSGRHDAEFYRGIWDTLGRGGVWAGRLVNRRKDGTLFEEDARIAPVLDPAGRVVNYVAVKRDVTIEVELQERLLLAQKQEAIGRLAGGVAHDFNNLLGVVTGYTGLAQQGLPAGHPVGARLEQILKAAEQAAGLTRQLLAFSRKQILQPKVLNLNALLAEREAMLRRLVREDVDLVVSLGPELGNVKADPAQIEQIILNLVANARDAMPQGGRLAIETANAEFDAAYAASHPTASPGPHVMLAVSDTGEGMDAEAQAHVFEPFFTTKQLGKGTGLGLATVYGIVKQSGGYIWAYSELGVGTTFKVYLPRVDEQEAVGPRGEAPRPPSQASETVLLVEDGAVLRGLLCETLAGRGYRVLVARDGAEALQVADEHAGPIHLLLTDVIMPGFTGVDVAEQLRPTRPEMKVLFISGYADAASVQRGLVGAGPAFLSKPFTPDALLRKVRALLVGQ